MELVEHLNRQKKFAMKTFGPGRKTQGLIKHIMSELKEIEESPLNAEEWIDVVILAFEGAIRTGLSVVDIVDTLAQKQIKNEKREWPDYHKFGQDEPIEHIK